MSNELEQFCVIARSQKDRACANIIQQVLKDKKIHVFGELLAIPSVQALRGTEFNSALATLELFAYGTYSEYTANPSQYLELTPFMTQKLRRLSLFSLAAVTNQLSYALLLSALGLQTLRDLEAFIVDAIYSGLIVGKLDQMGSVFKVSWVTARDVRPDEISSIMEKLASWQARCMAAKDVLHSVSVETSKKRHAYEREQVQLQKQADHEREQIKALMESGNMDVDEDYGLGALGAGHGHRQHHSHRPKGGSSKSSALERLGLGIGGSIGGGRSSSNTTFLSSTRSKF